MPCQFASNWVRKIVKFYLSNQIIQQFYWPKPQKCLNILVIKLVWIPLNTTKVFQRPVNKIFVNYLSELSSYLNYPNWRLSSIGQQWNLVTAY